jgi:acetoin utilization protein AcuB
MKAMLVRDRMTPNPTTVRPNSDPMAARMLLRYNNFRRLPVVDESGQVVGIVTDSDLELFLATAPSPGVVKRQYRVDQMMTTPVITVSPDYPLEEAAQLMLKHKIGGLPVVEGEQLVGIITRDDILAQLVEALGGETTSFRITVQVADRPGQLAQVATKIAELNCNIASVISARAGDRLNFTMRIQGAECEACVRAIRDLDEITVIQVWANSQSDETAEE